jgi:hypothetical protein
VVRTLRSRRCKKNVPRARFEVSLPVIIKITIFLTQRMGARGSYETLLPVCTIQHGVTFHNCVPLFETRGNSNRDMTVCVYVIQTSTDELERIWKEASLT